MTRFIQADYPTEHAGVVRFTRVFEGARDAIRNFDGARGTASMLLAALVSALLVVANQVVDTWTEGHLLAAWIAMWVIGFATLALFAAPARRAGSAARDALRALAERRRQAEEDDKLWNVALTDARVMADLSRAMSREANRDVRGYY